MKRVPAWLFAFLLIGVALAASAAATELKPDLRTELVKNGPVLWFGTFGSPEAVKSDALNVGDLVEAGAKTNAKAIIIMAKGQPGFCVWDCKDYDYSLRGVSTKDYLGEFINACKVRGITPGVFYSIVDVHSEGKSQSSGAVQAPYFNLIKEQVAELLSRYPDFQFLALHGANRCSASQWADLLKIISQVSPKCVVLGEERAANKTGILVFQWTAGTAGLKWKDGTTAESLYASCAKDIARDQVSFAMVWADKETGNMAEGKVTALTKVRQMLEAKMPPAAAPAK
jgi:hypothetical protein